jgi:DNA replication protein DnaC
VDPAEVLRVLLAEEVTGRDAATRRMRRKAASFPTGKTLASWRPEESSIPQATQQALVTLEWISRTENLAVAGPSGTGKSTSSKPWRTPPSRLTCGLLGSPWSR